MKDACYKKVMGILSKFVRWIVNLFHNNKTGLHDEQGKPIEGTGGHN